MSSSRRMLAVVAAVAVGSAAVGWVAGQTIKSPAEVAADAEPPEASLVTVPVEEVALTSNVVIRGQISFSESYQVQASAGAGGVAIVTGLPVAEGDDLVEGQVLAEIAGRPMIALQGQLPVFRSLTPGLEGPDVQQLEEALIRLGYDPGPVDTVYDAETEAAVELLYRERGYTPNLPSFDAVSALEAAQDRVRGAQESLRIAEDAVANSGVSTSTKLQLDQAVANAEQALAIVSGQSTIARTEAAAAVATAQNQYNLEPTAENAAALRTAEATEIVVNREQDLAIGNAAGQVEIARALRAEGLENDNAEGAGRQRDDAREELADAIDDLARLDSQIGVIFPATELVFLPSLPREVQVLTTAPGQTIDGPVMTVSGSGVIIDSAVSASDRGLVSVGLEALVEDETLGISVRATIVSIADTPGGEASSDRYAMRLEPLDELPAAAFEQSLRVSIPIESTGGDVLAVPLAAVSAGPDGGARVEVERAGGQAELGPVVTGLRAEGYVEIAAVEGSLLAAGDRVVVGRDLQLPDE